MMEKINNHSLSDYRGFLRFFLDRGYNFKSFDDFERKGNIILRHDIDFSISYALKAAKIEADLGISSTFFFLMRSGFYNVFSQESYDSIKKIQGLGHRISIHFDPIIYEDFKEGLKLEMSYFESLFGIKVNLISLHRPNEFFLKYDQNIEGVKHTYMSEYCRDLKYYSDSTGEWRYGHPFNSEEVQSMDSMQVLTHPLWWFLEGANNIEKLENFWFETTRELEAEFSKNSTPFMQNLKGISKPTRSRR